MNEDRASRYHRLSRQSAVLSVCATAAMLTGILASGAPTALRDATRSATPALAVALSAVMLGLAIELTAFPLAFYRQAYLERRYGLSTATTASWMADHAKAALLSLLLGLLLAEVVYASIRAWPDWWWLATAGIVAAGLIVLSAMAPIVMLPLFYRFTALDRDTLRVRLVSLSAKAGVPVLDVYRWGLGEKTRRANAALVGGPGTRRILLSDTLLEEYSDDEIEVIIAHELAHHVHRDIPKALAVEAILLAAAFGACAIALRQPWLAGGLRSPADVSGMPLLLLVGGAVMLAGTPLMHALSRMNERRADRYALRLTGMSAAFVSAMRRLAAQNLAESHPSSLVRWLFYSHPPVQERIDAARDFERANAA